MTSTLYAPVDGVVKKMENVPDQVFADKMMGDGAAIEPETFLFRAPCAGEIMHVFPSKHAVSFRNEEGLEIMIHIGLDTVYLKGKGFKSFVAEGDRVQTGDPLIKVNPKKVQKHDKPLITPIVITNMDRVKQLSLREGRKASGEAMLELVIHEEI